MTEAKHPCSSTALERHRVAGDSGDSVAAVYRVAFAHEITIPASPEHGEFGLTLNDA